MRGKAGYFFLKYSRKTSSRKYSCSYIGLSLVYFTSK